MAGSYEIRVITDRVSFTPIILTNAVPGKAYRELNNWGTFDFSIPTTDAQAVECLPLQREVQLWRDAVCIWWGVIAKRTHDGEWTKVQCYGLEWYFSRRLFGPIQTNYASNGSFESGLANWTAVNCTASLDTSWKVKGSQSVKLHAAAYGLDAYLGQTFSVSGNPDQAVAYKAVAVFRVNPTDGWLGTALFERGLYIDLLSGGVSQYGGAWEPITNDSQHDGTEVLIETPELSVPAGQTWTMDLRLYCPAPGINWDLVAVHVQESVSTPVAGEDAATLIQRVVDYAQHGTGKSDLNIGFAYTPTGQHLPLRAYQFYDNGSVWESFGEFVTGGVCDIGVTWNAAGTQRTFTLWPAPGRGSLKADLQLDLATSGRLAAMTYEEDGEQAATKIRALGQGTGATREVDEAVDTSSLGGLVLEDSVNTSLETLVGGLYGIASTELARRKAAVKVPKLTTHENAGPVIANLDLGDTIPVVISYGWVQENSTRRVVGISIDCPTDTLEPTVN